MKRILLIFVLAGILVFSSCHKPEVFEPVLSQSEQEYAETKTFGGTGTADDQFGVIGGIVSYGNYVYVLDVMYNEVRKFDKQGQFIRNWDYYTTKKERAFDVPAKVAIGYDGVIYVLMDSFATINKFSKSGEFLGSISYSKNKGTVTSINDFTVDEKGNIYMLLSSGTISKFNESLILLDTFAGYGAEDGKFIQPTGIVYNNGSLYIADTSKDNVQKLSATTGEFILKWGETGDGPGQFNDPQKITADKLGYVYVCDGANLKVQKFSPHGALVGRWNVQTSVKIPYFPFEGITVNDSSVYITEATENYVHKFEMK